MKNHRERMDQNRIPTKVINAMDEKIRKIMDAIEDLKKSETP